jgi:hypothetical protein
MIHTYGSKLDKKKVRKATKMEEKKIDCSLEACEEQHQCECCGKRSKSLICNECNEYFYELEMIVEIEKTLSEGSMDNVDPSEPY